MTHCSPAQPNVAPLWPNGHVPTATCWRSQSQISSAKIEESDTPLANNSTSHFSPAVVIKTLLLLVTFLCCQAALAQRCLINPNNPVAVPTGGGYGFSEISCGDNIVWSVTGGG